MIAPARSRSGSCRSSAGGIRPLRASGAQLVALPQRVDQLVGRRGRLGGGVDERPEADHQRGREGPRLRRRRTRRRQPRRRSPRGPRGPPPPRASRPARRSRPGPTTGSRGRRAGGSAGSGRRRCTSIVIAGSVRGNSDQSAHGAAAAVAGRLDHGGVAGAPAEAVDAMPADHGDGVGGECRPRPVRARRPVRGVGRTADLAVAGPAVAGRVVREQRRARVVEPEERELGARPAARRAAPATGLDRRRPRPPGRDRRARRARCRAGAGARPRRWRAAARRGRGCRRRRRSRWLRASQGSSSRSSILRHTRSPTG